MKYKALLTDVDGTAVISEVRNFKVIEDVAKQGGFIIEENHWPMFFGNGDEIFWQVICRIYPDFKNTYPTEESFMQALRDEYTNRIDEVEDNEPVHDIVRMFRQNAIDVVAVSNSEHDIVEENLVHCEYDLDEFTAIIGKEDVINAGLQTKPAPDAYLFALNKVNQRKTAANESLIQAKECIVLENSGTGAKSGLRAGMAVVHIIDEGGAIEDDKAADLINDHGGRYFKCTSDTVPMIVMALMREMEYKPCDPAGVPLKSGGRAFTP